MIVTDCAKTMFHDIVSMVVDVARASVIVHANPLHTNHIITVCRAAELTTALFAVFLGMNVDHV